MHHSNAKSSRAMVSVRPQGKPFPEARDTAFAPTRNVQHTHCGPPVIPVANSDTLQHTKPIYQPSIATANTRHKEITATLIN